MKDLFLKECKAFWLKLNYNHFIVKCNITVNNGIRKAQMAHFLLIAKDVNILGKPAFFY